MNARNLFTMGLVVLWMHTGACADSANAQKEAIAAYPDLAKAGSPLHIKFIELHQKAKATNSPVLSRPDWPLQLAREASEALLIGVPLQATKIYCPTSDEPDLALNDNKTDAEREADWQKVHGHRLTVPAHFFSVEEGKAVFGSPAVPPAGVLLGLAKFKEIARKADVDGLRRLTFPEHRVAFDAEFAQAGAKETFTANIHEAEPVQLLLVLQIDGMCIAFVRTAIGLVTWVPFLRSGNEYLITTMDYLKFPPEKITLLGDITRFIQNKPTADGLRDE